MRTLNTNITNNILFSSIFLVFSIFFISTEGETLSQWCIPSITETFNHGIRNVTLNGVPEINRTSGLAENYIYTQLSTTLVRGSQYSGSMLLGFGAFCTAGNLRIWIDFNRDYDFNDAGELIFTVDNLSTLNAIPFSFTVPNDAYIGTTRMRVMDKMMVSCGHTMPTVCNDPPDPIGFHGEAEDYDIIISNTVGLVQINNNIPGKFSLYQNYPNPFNPSTDIEFDVPTASAVNLTIYDLNGKEITSLVNETLSPGKYKVNWDAAKYTSGLYIYKLTAGNYSEVKKMILVK